MSLGDLRQRGDLAFERGVQTAGAALGRLPRAWLDAVIMLFASLLLTYLFVFEEPAYAVAFVVVLFAALFLMRRPVALTYVLFALIPVYWLNLLGRRWRVMTVLTFIALAYYLGRGVLQRRRPVYNSVFLAYGLFLLTFILSLINSVEVADVSWPGVKYFLFSLMLVLVLVFSIREERQLKVLFWILLGGGLVEAVWGALQTFVSPEFYLTRNYLSTIDAYSVGGVRRAAGSFQIGPRYAMYLMAPLAIVVAGLLSGRVLSRRVWLAMLVPYVFGLFASLTRIAIVLSVCYILLYNFFERRRQAFMASVAGLLLISMIVGVTVLATPEDIKHALVQRFTDEDDEVYTDRLFFLWNALGAFSEHPILGIGIGTYEFRSLEFMQKYPIPWRELEWDVAKQRNMPETVPVHNEYGRMLAEQGIFAIPIFLFLLWSAYRNLRYVRRETKSELLILFSTGMLMYLAAMAAYWFFHEYFLEEPYISLIPFALSVVMYNLVQREKATAVDATRA